MSLFNCLLYANKVTGRVGGNSYGDAIFAGGGTTVLENCTVAYHPNNGIYQSGSAVVAITNSILWHNAGNDVLGSAALAYSNTESGLDVEANNNIASDPMFEFGFYLGAGSLSRDAGSTTAAALGLDMRTTRTDGAPDSGTVDLGYHYPAGFDTTYANIYVNPATGDDDSHDGLTPAEPFATIAKALEQAQDGTRIHLAAGEYSTGNVPSAFTINNRFGLQLLGAGSDTTILTRTHSHARVMQMSRVHGARIANLAIRGGYRNDGSGQGGGLFITDCIGLTIEDCAFENNTARSFYGRSEGGALFAHNSLLTINRSSFTGNKLKAGNHIHSHDLAKGGAIFISSRCGINLIQNSMIVSNRIEVLDAPSYQSHGGGLWAGARVTLRNNLITHNDAESVNVGGHPAYGHGASTSGELRIENCTIADNAGQGVHRAGGLLDVQNSILWNNGIDVTGTVHVAWSNVQVADPAATLSNTLSTDPLFIDAPGGNYRLRGDSPSVNTGNPVSQDWMASAVDLDGKPRLVGRIDMGAYEAPARGTVIMVQ